MLDQRTLVSVANGVEVVANSDAHSYLGVRRDCFIRLRRNNDAFPRAFRLDGVGELYYRRRELDLWMQPEKAAAEQRALMEDQSKLADLLASTLAKFSIDISDRAKATSGIYLLYCGDELLYVGQSVNVYSRIRNHRHMGYDRVLFLPCAEEQMDLIESLTITLLRPPRNGPAPIRAYELLEIVSPHDL